MTEPPIPPSPSTPPTPPTAPPPRPPVSAGTLFYLWADHVLPPATGFLKVNARTPSGAEVDAGHLSALVFAVSIWNLRETGALTLTPTQRTSLGLIKNDDAALALGANVQPRSGYEDVVMRKVAEGQRTAYDVVRSWYPRDVSSPELSVFAIAREEIPAQGLGLEADAGRGAVSGFFQGTTELRVDTEAVRGTWPDFWRLHEAWKAFWSADRLAYQLLESCRQAIASREDSD